MKENQIKAVHQRDFKKLLLSLEVYNSVLGKNESCYFCGDIVSEQTISAVFPFDESVCFCCENPDCCRSLIEMESEEDENG